MIYSRDELITLTWNFLMGSLESRTLHTTPGDPGGATKFGFAQRFNPDIDVKQLTEETAKKRFIEKWWDQYKCDEIKNQSLAVAFICTVFNTPQALKSLAHAKHYSDALERFIADVIINKYAIHHTWPEGLVIRALKTYLFAKSIGGDR